MTLRRVVPVDGGAIDLDAPDARSTLLDWYQPRSPEYLRLNLVATLDGRAAGADGTSESLTSRTDRTILGVIRELADVVLVGAESVRREGYVRPRRAALAIVSASGDLTGHRLEAHPDRDAPIIVLTTEAGSTRAAVSVPRASVELLESDEAGRISAAQIVAALHARGMQAIVAEGGPTMAALLMTAGLVDELCLTTMPRVGGPSLPLFGAAPSPVIPVEASQLLVDDSGAQFGRWAVRPAP